MAVDGTLKFDTKIDTDGVENGVSSVKDVIKKLISSLENLAGAVTKAFNNINVDEVTAEVKDVEHSIDSAADSIVEMANDTVQATAQAEASVEQLDDALDNITITRWDDVEKEIYEVAEVLEEVENQAIDTSQAINEVAIESKDISQEVRKIDDEPLEEMSNTSVELNNMLNLIKRTFQSMPAVIGTVGERIKNAFSSDKTEMVETENEIQQLVDKIDTYRDAITSMEGKGLYFGDQEYDEAYRELSSMEQKLKDYKKELTSIDGEQKKVSKSADKASKNATKVGHSMKNSEKKASKLSKTLGMLGKSLMFSIVFRAFSAVTNAIKEGFQNLAQYSPQANKSISALATSLQTLKNSFATAFSPILTAITPALQTLISYLSHAITTAGQFFAVFLNGSTTFTKAKDAQVDYAKSLKSTEKQSNKALSSIDKLNTVNTGSGSGVNEGTPLPKDMFEEVKINSKITDFIDKMKEKLKPTIEAFDRLIIALQPLKENVGKGLLWFYKNVLVPIGNWAVTDLIPAFLDLLSASVKVLNDTIVAIQPYALWFFENFLKPIGKWTGQAIVDGLNLMTDALYGLSGWISDNKESLIIATALVTSFFLAFKVVGLVASLMPLISAFVSLVTSGQLLSTTLAVLSTFLGTISAPIVIAVAVLGELIFSFFTLYRKSEEFRNQIKELGNTWKSSLEPLATFVKTVLTDAWKKILQPVIEYFVKDLLPKIHKTFENLWKKVLVPLADFLGVVLKPIFKAVGDVLESLWKNVVLPLATAFGTTLKEAFNGLYEIMNKTVIPVVGKLIDALMWLWKNVINPIVNVLWDILKPAFDSVFKGIGDLVTGFSGILKGLITFITGVFTGNWKKAWEGVKGIFKGIWDSLVGVVKVPVNLIIDIINGLVQGVLSGINAIIRGVNSISFEMPEWLGGGKVGFNLKTLSVPKIPKLATGAVIPPNSEFLAILGDQKKGTNIEAPLDTIVEAFKAVVGSNGSGNGTDLHLHVYEDGKLRFEQTVRYEKENYNRTGKSVFVH